MSWDFRKLGFMFDYILSLRSFFGDGFEGKQTLFSNNSRKFTLETHHEKFIGFFSVLLSFAFSDRVVY
jgi:hypothetical protein